MEHLPVCLDLRGRTVLVVGGGEVAERKVRLLLEAGAQVRLVAPALNEALSQWQGQGRLDYRPGLFAPEQLDGAMLVYACTNDPAVNDRIAAAAAERQVFVNCVDDAARSTLIMPAIVDRSPVTVAVSTGGRSPVLARHLRAQLEALLPSGLGALAERAARWRVRVREVLPTPADRLRFWDRLFARLFSHGIETASAPEPMLWEQALADAATPRGEVYLIGAGPGDADLLTLRALQLLQQADVILYDRLVGEGVLQRARRDAELIYVGKESGQHRATQTRIHELMLEHARAGRRVARIKGGDPFIFGRGGEELAVLRAAGVPVTVVPGITAALGAAAAVQLPLTHRGLAHAVSFVTIAGPGAATLDWPALARPLQTVVFYMSSSALGEVIERLRAAGAPAERAAMLVERATLPEQRAIRGTIGTLCARADEAGIAPPALLIVGDVAALAP